MTFLYGVEQFGAYHLVARRFGERVVGIDARYREEVDFGELANGVAVELIVRLRCEELEAHILVAAYAANEGEHRVGGERGEVPLVYVGLLEYGGQVRPGLAVVAHRHAELRRGAVPGTVVALDGAHHYGVGQAGGVSSLEAQVVRLCRVLFGIPRGVPPCVDVVVDEGVQILAFVH